MLRSAPMADATAALSGTSVRPRHHSIHLSVATATLSLSLTDAVSTRFAAARSKVQAFLEAACSGDLDALRSTCPASASPVPPALDPFRPVQLSHLLFFRLAAAGLGSALDEEGKGAAAVAAGVRDANKRTALHFAAREGRTEVCRFLLEQLRLPVDPKDDDGTVPYPSPPC